MPGSPTQKFQPTPLATGIGGGLSAASIMGMFGGANTQQQAQAPALGGQWYNPVGGTGPAGAGGVYQTAR